jgi:c-di-GMP-related signal transduction protein
MDVLVARQAIFDRRMNVYGYELLYRSCQDNFFDGTDGSIASAQVITNSLFAIGLEKMLGGKLGFVNFSRELLVGDCASVLPRQKTVIEVLESIQPDKEVIAACQRLRRQGYLIALDDFPRNGNSAPLVGVADIIKVDFRTTDPPEQRELLNRYGKRGIRMLAEKVETQDEFERARWMGYVYFQGYFFARPVIVQGREIPGFKLNYLRILREIHHPDMDFHRLEEALKPEVSLTYKLLRYVNSAAFGFSRRIESIREALVLVGEKEIRKWASLVVLPQLAGNRPAELVATAAVRARFCELMARPVALGARSSELFLMGLFSLLDVMMGRPLDEILDQLHLATDLRATLLGRPEGKLAAIHALVHAQEKGDWEAASAAAARLEVPMEQVAELYLNAVQWADQVFESSD